LFLKSPNQACLNEGFEKNKNRSKSGLIWCLWSRPPGITDERSEEVIPGSCTHPPNPLLYFVKKGAFYLVYRYLQHFVQPAIIRRRGKIKRPEGSFKRCRIRPPGITDERSEEVIPVCRPLLTPRKTRCCPSPGREGLWFCISWIFIFRI